MSTLDHEDAGEYRPGGFHPIHLGDILAGRYKIHHKLGHGTYATVWLAEDMICETRQCVAVKVNRADLTGKTNELSILRWIAEHPSVHPGRRHILALFDSFHINGPNGTHEVLVTEIIVSLFALRDYSLLGFKAKHLIREIVLGLGYLQKCGIAHGDLHTANVGVVLRGIETHSIREIMHDLDAPYRIPMSFDNDGVSKASVPQYMVSSFSIFEHMKPLIRMRGLGCVSVQIVDFGSASRRSDHRLPFGNPLCMRPPEFVFEIAQIEDDTDRLFAADMWSLGCTVYEVLFGPPLFRVLGEGMLMAQLLSLFWPLPDTWMKSKSLVLFLSANEDIAEDIENTSTSFWEESRLEIIGMDTHLQVRSADDAIDFMRRIIQLEPTQRARAVELVDHPWFDDCKTNEYWGLKLLGDELCSDDEEEDDEEDM